MQPNTDEKANSTMTPLHDSSGSDYSTVSTPLDPTFNPNSNTPTDVENSDDELETHRIPSNVVISSSETNNNVASTSYDVMNNNNMDLQWNAEFPPGYRFCPGDGELIYYYLRRKIMNLRLPHDKIKDVNLYLYNPENLCEEYRPVGDNEWYFFTPRDRKYRNGERPNRAAGNGYWKATGADRDVHHPQHENELVGHKKTLVFYDGKPPKGIKSNWIMHEYKIEKISSRKRLHDTDMRLDDWVLCRIYNKNDKSPRGNNNIKVKSSNERNPNSVDHQCLTAHPESEMVVEDEELATQIELIANLNYHHDYVLEDNPGLFFNNDYNKNTLDSIISYHPPQLPNLPHIFPQHPDLPYTFDLPQTYLDVSYIDKKLYNFQSNNYQRGFDDNPDVKPLRSSMTSIPAYSQPVADNKFTTSMFDFELDDMDGSK